MAIGGTCRSGQPGNHEFERPKYLHDRVRAGRCSNRDDEDVPEQPFQPCDVLGNIVNLLPSGCHVPLHRRPLIQQTERKT